MKSVSKSSKRLAIVSGSRGGIGHALMIELANRGYQACEIDIVKGLGIDITTSLKETFRSFTRECQEIGIVINCAGITGANSIKDPRKTMNAILRRQFEVNFFGMINVVKESLQYMRKGGSIVNVASKSASFATGDRLGYCASKGAVVSASRQMAVDLAPNIRVNSVSPGMIDTSMVGSLVKEMHNPHNLLRRKGTAEETAKFICDIADNEYATGQDYILDGGYCAV
jgi:NAD(P)-dependent dehydrogenase (short-subunit alcohol dehydrogenase family)